jgi:hypothetical protein
MADLENPSKSVPIPQRTPEEPKPYLWFLQVAVVIGLSLAAILLCLTPKSPIYTVTYA